MSSHDYNQMPRIAALVLCRALTWFRFALSKGRDDVTLSLLYDGSTREYDLVPRRASNAVGMFSSAGRDSAAVRARKGLTISLGHIHCVFFSAVCAVNGKYVPPENIVAGLTNRTSEINDGHSSMILSRDQFYMARLTPQDQELLKTRYVTQLRDEWQPMLFQRGK